MAYTDIDDFDTGLSIREKLNTGLALADTALQPGDEQTPFILAGTATDGTPSTLIDDTQAWSEHQWEGHRVVIDRDGTQTRHTIIGNTSDTIGLSPPLGTDTEATATIGSGENPEGQIEVTLIGKGADGDNWTLLLIAGEGSTGEDTATADVETKTITLVVDSDGGGNPRPLLAGNLAGILAADVPTHLSAPDDGFTAGTLPLGTIAEPLVVTFSGGVDAETIAEGDQYWLLTEAFATPDQGALADTAVQPNTATQLGGADDYLNIAADGTPTLVGDAVVWDDLDFAMAVRTGAQQNPPVWTQVSNSGFYGWAFENGDEAFMSRQIPHRYKVGANWRAHVHWMPTTTATYTGTWTMELIGHATKTDPTEAPLFAKVTRTGAFDVSATAWQGHLTQLDNGTPGTEIDGSAWGISTILFARLTLTLSAGASCFLSGFDLHGQVDAFGSAEEYVK